MGARVLSEAEISAAAPSFLRPERNWSGQCEAAGFNLTDAFTPGPVRSFPTATAARLASKIEGSGFGPAGAWVWMSGVWGTENGRSIDYGHVAYHLGGGLLFMASSSVRTIPGFTALGFIDGNAYLRRFSNQKLEGWSWDHGGTVIPTLPTTTPGPVLTAPELVQRSIDMAGPMVIKHVTNGGKDQQFYVFDVELDVPILIPEGTPAKIAARAFGQDEEKIPLFSNLEGTDMLVNLARAYRDARDRTHAEDVKRRGTYA